LRQTKAGAARSVVWRPGRGSNMLLFARDKLAEQAAAGMCLQFGNM
jgi:hypothetical protein